MKRLKRKVPSSLAFGIIAVVIIVLGAWMYALQASYDLETLTLSQETSNNTISAPAGASTGRSATIVASSLVSNSGRPTISGSAVGVRQVEVVVRGNGLPNGFRVYPCWVPVVNGRWSITFAANQTLQTGSYSITVLGTSGQYDCSVQPTASNSYTLAHGTLVVK